MGPTARAKWIALIVATLGLAWQQLPLLRQDPLLHRDDRSFLEPLDSLGASFRDPQVLDVQPVRDVSYLLNLWLARKTGHGFFHALNVLLVLVCLYWLLRLYHLLEHRSGRTASSFDTVLLSVLFVFHSTLAVATSWVGARKHLLAGCFILMATCLAAEMKFRGPSKPKAWATYVGYVLSIFSHPIHLLWPILGGALLLKEVLRARWMQVAAGLFALTLLVTAFLNHAHYTSAIYANRPKLGFEYNAAGWLAQWARAMANVFLPGPRPTLYNPHHFPVWQNALLLLAATAVIIFAARKSSALRWVVGLGLLPMALMFSQPTNIFLADTYLFLPATCAVLASVLALPSATAGRNLGRALLVAVAVAHAAFARDIATSYTSDFELWKYAYEAERYFQTDVRYAGQLLRAGEAKLATDVLLSSPDARNDAQYPLALGRAVYENASLRWEDKLPLLARETFNNDWFLYYRALVAVNLNRWSDARKDVGQLARLPSYKGSVPPSEVERLQQFLSRQSPEAGSPETSGLENGPPSR